MHEIVTDIYHLIVDTILPIRCVVCRKENKEAVCSKCVQSFAAPDHQRCIICTKTSPFGLTHAHCKTTRTPDRTVCVFDYKDAACAESIIAGKYKLIPGVFNTLGGYVAEQLQQTLGTINPENILVTPLPLHPRRRRWRGFNQSELLAQSISKKLGATFAHTLLRIRPTKTQKNLKRLQREKNVADCFAIDTNTDVQHTLILLIDDVTTTGSTLREAAAVLKRAGASTVWCVALAQD